MNGVRMVPSGSGALRRAGFALLTVASLAGQEAYAQAQAPAPAASSPGPAAVPVTTAHAKRMDFPVYLSGLGQVQAANAVLVRARVDGALMQVPVTEGQTVKQGDLVAVIDPRPFKAALDQAEAKKAQDQALLANAKLDQARYATLARQDFASRQQVDTQQALVNQYTAALAGDDAAIEAARLNLGFCYISSPIQGRVGLRQVDPGNLIHATDATGIVSITQVQPIAATFTLPQDALPHINEAMAAGTLSVLAYASDDKTLLDRGSLLTPDNAIDPSTGTIKLKAMFPNPTNKLWPGQFINAHLLVDTRPNALTVPSHAIQHGPNGLYVYLINSDSTVAREPVEVSDDDGKVAVIVKGLTDTAVVVTDGQSRLQVGMRVAAEQPETAKPAGTGS
jgi:multidrug efflux system membrane fusion protein